MLLTAVTSSSQHDKHNTVYKAKSLLTGLQDAVDELLARDLAVVVAVLLAKEIHHARLVVVHPAHVATPPLVKVKVLHPLQLLTQSRSHKLHITSQLMGGSIAEWLACWTQAQKAWVQIAVATLSGNSLRQTVHTHRASVHQAAKLVATLLRVVGVTAGLVKSNGSLPPGL